MGGHLTETDKGMIAGLVDLGWSGRQIASHLKLPKSSVQPYVNEWKSTGQFQSRKKGSGRPRKTTEQTDRLICRSVVGTPQKRGASSSSVAADLLSGGIEVSPRTVRRRLVENGFKSRVALKKPKLRAVNIKKRLEWAKIHVKWTVQDWAKVLWSDESPFELFGSKGQNLIRCRDGERQHPDCVQQTVKHGGGKLMVWGCFSVKGMGPLIKVNGIMDQTVYKNILVQQARPTLVRDGLTIFQQDNDPKHTAKRNLSYMNGPRFPASLLNWPAQSPNLNPIENLWLILDGKVRKRQVKPKNLEELMGMLQYEWSQIGPEIIQNLVNSMPRRCAAVIEAKGLWTKY